MKAMLSLFTTSSVWRPWEGQAFELDLQRPDDKSDEDDHGERKPVEVARVVSAAHASQTVCKLDTDNNDLQSDEELSDVLETDSQPGVEETSVFAVIEEGLLERWDEAENDTNERANSGRTNELSDERQCVLNARMKLVPNSVLGLRSAAGVSLRVSRETAGEERCALVGLLAVGRMVVVVSSSVAQILIH